MTIKELYEWAKKNSVENIDIELKIHDVEGWYYEEHTPISEAYIKTEDGRKFILLA